MVITPEVRKLLTLNERGNSLFVSDDGNFVFAADLGEGKDGRHLFFFITFVLENYPALNTSFWEATVEEVRKRLQRDLAGWRARKNNIGLQLDEDFCVADLGGEESEEEWDEEDEEELED